MFDLLAEAAVHGIGGTEAITIGVLVACVNGVVEIAKLALGRKKSGSGADLLSAIHSVVTRTDANGAPLVYGHRELSDRIADNTRAVDRLTAAMNRELDHGLDNFGRPQGYQPAGG